MIVTLSEDNIKLIARNFVATDNTGKIFLRVLSAQHFQHILRALIKTVIHHLVENHCAERHWINSA
jgi:hypothetical protein